MAASWIKVILLSLGSQENISHLSNFEQVRILTKQVVIWMILNNTVSQAAFGYLLLTVQHLYDSGTPCYTVGHQVLPAHPVPRVLRIWESVSYSQVFFTLHSFLLVLSLPWGAQFNLKVSRTLCWSSKHSCSPAIVSNNGNPQKRYGGRFYLCASGHFWSKGSTAMEPSSHWFWTCEGSLTIEPASHWFRTCILNSPTC